MKAEIEVATPSTILEEVVRRQGMIARRAFELFQSHSDFMNSELDDWLTAERELSPQPEVTFRQADGCFEIDAALPGVDPKKVEVKVAGEDVLICGEREAGAADSPTAATAGRPPDGAVRYFACIHLPQSIQPKKVTANFKKGHLHLTAPIAKPRMTKVEVES
jgi:HSP20 family molecular chaperone IbpA